MAEKTVNEIPRDVRALYVKGNEALARENPDYAISLYNQVLSREPAFYECRERLHRTQAQKVGTGGGFFKKVMNMGGSSPALAKAQLVLHKDPGGAMELAEQALNTDPTSSLAHKIIVEAAGILELPKTAVLSLEALAKSHPKDRDIAIKFANALAAIGQAHRAEEVLTEMSRAFPYDQELAQAAKDISARKTLDEGGYEALADGSGSYRDILKDKDASVALEQEQRQVKTEDVTEKLIREYEARLANEPKNLKLIRSLAELYTSKKAFDKAMGYYDLIKASDLGADASLDQAMAETVSRKYDHQIAQLDPASPEYSDQLAALQAEKQAYQVAECQKRVERFPTDLGFRFELGQLYFQAGKLGEAIQELQKAQGNPHKRIAAMSLLAQCFARRKMYDLAARQFQNALKEKPVFDDEKKELVYHLGCVLESMGKKEEAFEQLKLIYEVDIGYRDVSAKVDAYYSSQG